MAAFGTAGRGFDAIAGEDAFDKVTFRSPCTLLTDDVETVVKEPVFVLTLAITTLFDGDVLVSGLGPMVLLGPLRGLEVGPMAL